MALGDTLERLPGAPFEVRHSAGSRVRAAAIAEIASGAHAYFSDLFTPVAPDLALIVVDASDWTSSLPYGLAYFNDDADQIRPGIVVMPADGGALWTAIARDVGDATPAGHATLAAAYPDGSGGVDLQPFLDLVTVHELAHAFETFGDLRFPTHWLCEIFVNLAWHAFVAVRQPTRLPTLETLPTVGAASAELAQRMRRDGDTTLDELQAHYPGGPNPMDALNYVWFQHRWMRLAAQLFDAEGEAVLRRMWSGFQGDVHVGAGGVSAAALAPWLTREISPLLGRAVRDWR